MTVSPSATASNRTPAESAEGNEDNVTPEVSTLLPPSRIQTDIQLPAEPVIRRQVPVDDGGLAILT